MSAPSSLIVSPVDIEKLQLNPTTAGDATDGPSDTRTPDKPVIFTFTFSPDYQQSIFQSSYRGLLNILFERSVLRHARTPEQALALFAEYGQPSAVFVADPGIMLSRNEVVSQKLVQYTAAGGVVVFGGLFGANADHEALDRFFASTWDLPWEAGSQHRTTLALNRAAVDVALRDELVPSYSQQALFLQGVEHHESWYLPTEDSVVESYVPLPGPPDSSETPVACARFGNGRVGYVGDAGAEEGTIIVVLAMLGLLV